ncbi:MAG: hypothetical protein JXP73_02995 [Deltaproteobacteria bacterium]|nr:hypothetical protein [Deltaproteobacteria bacterium]
MQDQKTLTAGATVQGGYYVNRDKPDLVAIAGLGGTLPGDEGQRYFRAPAWAVLALAPLLGGLFLVLRALVGLSRLVPRLGRWFGSATKRAGRSLGLVVPRRWRQAGVGAADGQGEMAQQSPPATSAVDGDTPPAGRSGTG